MRRVGTAIGGMVKTRRGRYPAQRREEAKTMSTNNIFISYKHEQPWVDMAAKFRIKLANYADDWKLDYFIDSRQIAAGQPWRASIDAALGSCTHMLCLMCDTYWDSVECRRELDTLLARRAAGEGVVPFFVLAEPMNPAYLRFNPDGTRVGDVSKVGDFQFLGPYDDAQRLIALQSLGREHWSEAVEAMLTRLNRDLH
jgi:hypothetical protein